MLRIAQLLYLMLPVYLANMAPPFVKYWRGWNRPISRRWLGDHKTVTGFLMGVTVAVATAYAQSQLGWHDSLVDYEHWLALGLACGLGAMGGDAVKSFVKRRLGIRPGASWIPADQLDFVLGGLVTLSLFVRLRPLDVVLIIVLSLLGDIVVNHVSYRLGLRDTKW